MLRIAEASPYPCMCVCVFLCPSSVIPLLRQSTGVLLQKKPGSISNRKIERTLKKVDAISGVISNR